jgi:hypothetical protein
MSIWDLIRVQGDIFEGRTENMNIAICRICSKEDQVEYLHPLYNGLGGKCVQVCEECRDRIFSGRECSKREDLDRKCPHGFSRKGCCACDLKDRIDSEMRCSEHCGNTVREVR